ncbi:MAG: peptidylprolyl isomerase [Phycisphaerales bacterium]|nr:peptidylprolyl isomerase [Phycisphaerales bacterium]
MVGPDLAPAPVVAQPVLFDVKVGEVNNKPVFAAEFLDPIAQRLRAMAYRDVPLPGGGTTAQLIPREQWRFQANQVITEQLRTFVENELVIAEGLASFTPAQRTGLRNFIGLARRSLERNAGGSITRAVRELGTGQTLSEYLQDVRNQELIRQFYQELRRTIVVTRSDVQRAYLRRYGDAKRESTLTFRRIRVPLRDPEGAARISERLASGESFEEVATDELNTSRRSSGGLWPAMTFQGSRAEASFLANAPEIDMALRELTPGEWRGPIEDERNAHWVYVDGVEIGYKTWAEAQSELREELFMQRFEEANFRAMTRLFEQAGMTDIQTMRAELLEVATAWFYPTE